MTFLERVQGLLVGRTVVAVGYRGVPEEDDSELCGGEGITLTLDDGSVVYVGTDYEEAEFVVQEG